MTRLLKKLMLRGLYTLGGVCGDVETSQGMQSGSPPKKAILTFARSEIVGSSFRLYGRAKRIVAVVRISDNSQRTAERGPVSRCSPGSFTGQAIRFF